MIIFYISDTHFEHANIIKLAERPYKDIHEMNWSMVHNWNKVVKYDDVVWFLGDFAWRNHSEWFHRLGGIKNFIPGNHDEGAMALPWNDQMDYAEVTDTMCGKEVKLVLFHYPIVEWNGLYKGWYHFYGHVHNSLKEKMSVNWKARAFDVGVENIGYTPRTAEEIIMRGNT